MKAVAAVGLALLVTQVFAQYPGAKRVPGEWRTGFNSIKEEDAKDILGYLAGPELRGRGSLSPDYFAAAGFVANELRKMGLKPLGDGGSYFQRFDLVRATTVPEGTSIESADGSLKIPYGGEFQTSWISDLEGRVKFAFLNVPANADVNSINWESLRGRCVVITRAVFGNPAISAKLQALKEETAIEQTILASERLSGTVPSRATGVKDFPDPRSSGKVGPLRFTSAGMKKIADKCGVTKFFNENPSEVSLELPDQEFVVKVKVTQELTPLVNVVGMLPGSDPAMSKEAVMIGSHLDHVGPASDGIRYGADDNASGCTANLLVAKAMIENPTKPKRSVVFAFWAAEEVGLYGSYAYVSKPTFPLKDVVAYFNLDMLGRNEEFGVEIAENNTDVVYPGIVTTNSMDFYNKIVEANSFVNLRFKPDQQDRTNRSDTRNFVWKGIPTVKMFTGEHADYHRAGDTIDKINWTKLINITKLLYLAMSDLSVSPERPKFQRTTFNPPPYYVLAGRASYKEKIALPRGAQLEVTFQDVTDSTPKDLLSKTLPAVGSPIPFEILPPREQLVKGRKYALKFRVLVDGKEWFKSESPVAVADTGWARAQNVNLVSAR